MGLHNVLERINLVDVYVHLVLGHEIPQLVCVRLQLLARSEVAKQAGPHESQILGRETSVGCVSPSPVPEPSPQPVPRSPDGLKHLPSKKEKKRKRE